MSDLEFQQLSSKHKAIDVDSQEMLTKRTEEKYQMLFNGIDQGFFIIDVIYDENEQPVDMYYVEANAAATNILGRDYTGKRLTEIESNYESYWFEIFGKVALTGQSVRMEQYAEPDKKWYSFYIFRIGDEKSRRIGNIFLDITDRKRMEVALKDSAQLYRTLFENSADGFVLVEPIFAESGNSDNYFMVKVNQAWEKQTGLIAEELLGKTIRDSLPGVETIWPEKFANVIKSGESVRFESFNNNSKRWYDLYAFNYKEAHVGVLFRDISKRKKLEEELREIQQRQAFLLKFSDTLRSIADPVEIQAISVRLLGEHIAANHVHYAEVVGDYVIVHHAYGNGLPPMIGRFRYMDFGERLIATYRAGKTGVCYDVDLDPTITKDEAAVLRGSGIRAYVAVPLVKHGEWVSVLGVDSMEPRAWTADEVKLVEEVAERTWAAVERAKAEQALRESEEKFRLVQDLSPDGFTILRPERDIDGQIINFTFIYQNPAISRLGGTDANAVVGRRLLELFPGHQGTHILESYLHVAKTGEPRIFEAQYGLESMIKQTWFRIVVVRMNEDIAILAQDITERRRSEEALRESDKRANELVEELRKIDKNKNEFLGVLSHELRNPLAAIIMSLELLKRVTPGGEQSKKAQDIIERQAGQLSHLIDDLLDVTRITRNMIQLRKETVELNQLLSSVVNDYQGQFDEKGVQLEVEFESKEVFLEADPTRLIQVIGNLLHNAVKFTSKGDKTLLKVANDDYRKETIICIEDNGAGINPEMLPRLFQSFIQADSSLDRSSGGLGLGLAIVKGIVQLHGGSVEAYSEGLGKGTRFFLRLPMTRANANQQTQIQGCRKTDISLRILIIDDIPDIADCIAEILQCLGYEAVCAYNGQEGLSKARAYQPDVLLCDIGLPGMDGYEVARSIRNDDTLKDIFLVTLTGYALPEDLKRASEAGFQRHLAKPVDVAKLEQILAEVGRAKHEPAV